MDQSQRLMDEPPAPLYQSGEREPDRDAPQPAEFDNLGSRLQTRFTEFEQARRQIEEEWLRDMRQHNAQYDPEVLAKLPENRSKVFVGLTRTKVMAAYSRMVDLLFQRGERFYGIKPTPIPEIDPAKEAEIRRQALVEVAETAGEAYPDLVAERRRELRKAVQDEISEDAKLAAAEMELEIDDQLAEAHAEQGLKQTLMELCIFGSGAVKGGGTRVDQRKRYTKVGDAWQPVYEEVPKPDVQSCSIFDCFPEPFATSMHDCGEFFYRHRLNRADFRGLGVLPGFDQDRIDSVIRQNPNGTHQEGVVEQERRKTAGINTSFASDMRYQVLEYWGSITGNELIDLGLGVDADAWEEMSEDEREEKREEGEKVLLLERDAEYAANIWVADQQILMARLSPVPDGRIPYHIAPYEKVPHQFWGVGVPRMMRDSQVTMNAAIRIFLDNLAISSGPMAEVNADLLAAGEDPRDIHPWRVFIREGGDPSMPAVRFYQANTNNSGLAGVIDIMRRFADETTSLPSYTHGQQTDSLNETATGASMLMTAANIALKSTIKNVDDYMITPLIESIYAWNMQWNPREEIKGDFRIVARGSTALVQKELRSQRLMQFFQIMASNDITASLADWPTLVSEIAKGMDLDPDALTKIEEFMDAQAQALAQGGAAGPVAPGLEPGGVPSAAGDVPAAA